jgi:hypothetical protein
MGWRIAEGFVTERARLRAPQILEYLGVVGAALLVSPTGRVVLSSGAVEDDVDAEGIARRLAAVVPDKAEIVRSIRMHNTCIHALSIGHGWMLCALGTNGIDPGIVTTRLKRAGHVLDLALRDGWPSSPTGGGGSAPSGAPAHAWVSRNFAKNAGRGRTN